MFSSALKSFSSNITSNYTLSSQPSSSSGPWKIFEAKKKSTGKIASVFVFDKKVLDPQSGLGRTAGSTLRKAHEEVVERLKKEASSLARLRHPCVLELVEPLEETRNGGFMFATEQVTASLAGLLEEKDGQERAGGIGGRASRYVVEESDGGRRRREVEIDELEIQKGLLQIAKGLDFLHESAGLVHGNLTPDAIYINSKSDWKISGLGFSSPPDNSNKATSVAPISLSEALNHDPRLPRFVQLNLDYTSPDFVFDTSMTPSADMFSLGLLIIALYNSPHTSPIQTNSSQSTYKRLFNSSSSIPSLNNNFLSSRPIPKDLTSAVLPRLVTRRPATRLTAREFQDSQYFDNILVSTIRFLDTLPAKTPNEKAQFMRGLSRVLQQFPKSVMEKKVLPALLEEAKDKDLLSLILQNVFKIVNLMPSGRRVFSEKVIPQLRDVFLSPSSGVSSKGPAPDRDMAKEAGLMVLLENMSTITNSCSGKEFKEVLAIESPTHSLVDASLRSLPAVLPVLDYSTTKNDLFPVVASVFTKTNSLGIKVRGLEAFVVLCGGSSGSTPPADDGLNGAIADDLDKSKTASTGNALDKYVIQEKLVPLLKVIKTKEPAVMMAALNVFKHVGKIADAEFLALEVLPTLWSMSLGPLLNLQQFRSFIDLIKSLSTEVEQSQTRKLQELSASDSRTTKADDFMSFDSIGGANGINGSNNNSAEGDFERLVSGKSGGGGATNTLDSGWDSVPSTQAQKLKADLPTFSWSTPPTSASSSTFPSSASGSGAGAPSSSQGRRPGTITPDLSSFAALTPSGSATPSSFAQPLQAQPQSQPQHSFNTPQTSPSNTWASSSSTTSSNPWAAHSTAPSVTPSTLNSMSSSLSNMSFGQTATPTQPATQPSAFSIPPPPLTSSNSFQGVRSPGAASAFSSFAIAPPPLQSRASAGPARSGTGQGNAGQGSAGQGQKSGLDKYDSLL
ncbi:MAG: hypothetical protein M1833_007132 [Piccolia ochrophora]|nr:MAG: hypothetical protein M1833_007132 [Piccolia ochrophora]